MHVVLTCLRVLKRARLIQDGGQDGAPARDGQSTGGSTSTKPLCSTIPTATGQARALLVHFSPLACVALESCSAIQPLIQLPNKRNARVDICKDTINVNAFDSRQTPGASLWLGNSRY
jgi:hypothetical protein